jgi:CBS domain-containing protein
MTSNVHTVTRDTTIEELAQLLASNRISGAPVTDADGRLIGIVTEGDLIRRPEIGTDQKRRSWFHTFFETPEDLAYEFIRTHARYVREIMTREVISVGAATNLADVAETFEKRRIKRVPVKQDDKLVGIITRGDLVREIARRVTQKPAAAVKDDQEIAKLFRKTLEGQPWAHLSFINFGVKDGVIEMWGLVDSEVQRKALHVAAENIPGVKRIEDHVVVRPPYVAAE